MYIYPYIFPLPSIQSKTNDSTNSGTSCQCSTKTHIYDAFAGAFGLQCSFLRLLSKMTHSFACKTNRIVARVLQLIETIMHAWSVSARHVQVKNVFSVYGSTRVSCRNTLLNNFDDLRFVSQTYFHCQYYCVSLCVQPVT